MKAASTHTGGARRGLMAGLGVAGAALAVVLVSIPAQAGSVKCSGFDKKEIKPRDLGDLILGDDGDNRLKGTNNSDLIIGRGGNDLAKGNGGDDAICTGDGDDTALGGKGNDSINGGPGDDDLRGEQGRDSLKGGLGSDTCDKSQDVKGCTVEGQGDGGGD
jgi:hemolysin type calcium-binding protein